MQQKIQPSLTITKIISAPVALVYQAWTDAKQLAEWWGPKGFTNPICEINPNPDGKILIHMKAPDGVVYPMDGIYVELVENEKIIFISHALDNDNNRLFEMMNTIHFEAVGNATKLTMHAEVSKIKSEAEFYLKGMSEGWHQTLDRLEDFAKQRNGLHDNDTTGREISMTRLLNAPREMVWKVWTEPEHISKWWGPNGFTDTIEKMDLKPNGEWNHVLHGPDGTDYKNASVFVEVLKPEKIVFKHTNSPLSTTTVTFEAQGDKTFMQWKMVFESMEEYQKVDKNYRAGEGMKQNIEKMEAYLSNFGAE
jgi:uncharacterized protein YndB with AHSA1/START domain